jgi:hypothetical protein
MGAMNLFLRFLPIVLVISAATLLSACGGDDGSGGASAADREERAEKARLDYARCMRRNGINLADPQSGPGGGGIRVRVPAGVSRARLQAAERKCEKYLREAFGGRNPRDDPQFRDAALRFARCMRRNGVNVPDPDPDEQGIRIGGPGGGVNPDSPRFRAAMEKCRKELPGDGPRAAPSGGG